MKSSGRRASIGWLRTRRQNSKPSTSGIEMSARIIQGRFWTASCQAAAPSAASWIVKPCAASGIARYLRKAASSSAISTERSIGGTVLKSGMSSSP